MTLRSDDRIRENYSQPQMDSGEALRRLTFSQFSQANRERCESPQGFNHALGSWDTSDWFLAVLGELGEAANVAKKLNRVRDGIPGNKETPDELRAKLRREIGDVFVYLDLLAQAHGFTVDEAAVEVFDAKSREIGYPVALAEALESRPAPPLDHRVLASAMKKMLPPELLAEVIVHLDPLASFVEYLQTVDAALPAKETP